MRLLLRDDEVFFRKALSLMQRTTEDDPLIVNAIVIAESLWVLERRAKVERSAARAALGGFLDSDQIRVSDANPLRAWADTLAHPHRDYSDVIIAQINREIGCRFTYTLDEQASKRVPGMELLT